MEFDSALITSCQREGVVYKVHNSEPHVPPPLPVTASLARRSHVVYLYIQSICRNRFSPQASCCVSSLRKWCGVTTYRHSLATQDKHPFSPAHGDVWNYWFRASWDTGPGTRLSRKKKKNVWLFYFSPDFWTCIVTNTFLRPAAQCHPTWRAC